MDKFDAEKLKQNLNSTDTAKLMSAVSYVGGIADYLMVKKQICPPVGATIVNYVLTNNKELKNKSQGLTNINQWQFLQISF